MRIYFPIAACAAVFCLTGCAGTLALYDFEYHGTDAVRNDHEYFYVQQGVSGRAAVEYPLRGNRGVAHFKDGVVADAKNDLAANYPLSENQAYTNMAIDVIREDIGWFWMSTHYATRLRISAVISADIIEYGKPSGMASPSSDRGTRLQGENNTRADKSDLNGDDSGSNSSPESNVSQSMGTDDFVWIQFKDQVMYGYVQDINPDGSQIKVKFNFEGEEKNRWFVKSKVFQTKEEAEAE